MNIQVNKHQLERVVIKWLNKHFGDLRPVEHNAHPDSVFYVNPKNKVMMEWAKDTSHWSKYGDVWVDSEYIWSKMVSIFHINDTDIQSIMGKWLNNTYGLERITPNSESSFYHSRWRRITDSLNQNIKE